LGPVQTRPWRSMWAENIRLIGSLPCATSTPSYQVTLAPRSSSSRCSTREKECSAPTTAGLRIRHFRISRKAVRLFMRAPQRDKKQVGCGDETTLTGKEKEALMAPLMRFRHQS